MHQLAPQRLREPSIACLAPQYADCNGIARYASAEPTCTTTPRSRGFMRPPGVHPRMGSDRTGPSATVVLEPPGLLGTNYGRSTAVVTLVAHVAYGVVLGLALSP